MRWRDPTRCLVALPRLRAVAPSYLRGTYLSESAADLCAVAPVAAARSRLPGLWIPGEQRAGRRRTGLRCLRLTALLNMMRGGGLRRMIEKKLRDKIAQLIERAPTYTDAEIIERTGRWQADGEAWIVEAKNVVELAVPDFLNAYRNRMTTATILGAMLERVQTIASLLRSLLADIDAGLIGTLKAKVQAETFEDFLDHAVAYRNRGGKDQAGVIAGVIFEDTMRKIYADNIDRVARPDLEQVIIALTKQQVITEEQAKQARVAQLVRTKATHAEWDGFTMDGVDDTIKITKALIEAHLK